MTTQFSRLITTAERKLSVAGNRIVRGLPCEVQRIFHVEPRAARCVDAYHAPSSEVVAATRFYEGLIASPTQVVEFPIQEIGSNGRPTGNVIRRRTSIAELMKLGSDDTETSNYAENIFNSLLNDGVITYDRPDTNTRNEMLRGHYATRTIANNASNPVTAQTRDPRFADPTTILDYPESPMAGRIADPAHPTDPRLVPGAYPKIHNEFRRTVYFTPRVLDASIVTTARLRGLYENTVRAIFDKLKSRNCPMLFHPVVIACRQPIIPDINNYFYRYAPDTQGDIYDWRTNNGVGEFWIRNSVLGFSLPDGDQNPGPSITRGGSASGLWEQSLDQRIPITMSSGFSITHGSIDITNTRDEARTLNTHTADACFELLRLLNGLRFILDSGNEDVDGHACMVDLHATQAVYRIAQYESYIQINRPYGSNVTGYRALVQQETVARQAKAQGDIVAQFVPGYKSSGDEGADIAMGLIGSVTLAVEAAIATGNPAVGVVMFLVAGTILIVEFLLLPESPRDPYSLPLRVSGWNPISPMMYGITVTNALQATPVFRY